ncbi:hypothetical protein [Salinibacter ruber]|uniref:hypothetical protein n=1 Tax=Salinibacter ruber TaxID=146919 RepID=UPI00207454F8|nr:hypothetical protein [Salinibacter ruber]
MPNSEAFDRVIRGAIRRELSPRMVINPIVNRELVEGSFEEPDDTVELVDTASMSVSDYNGGFTGDIQDITGDTTKIEADHRKGFRFKVDETDTASQIAEQVAQQDGISNLLTAAQKYVLGLYSGADLEVTYDPANDSIRDSFKELAEKMDNANAPEAGRFAVLPPRAYHEIKEDLEVRDTALGDNVITGPGFGGVYKGFSVFRTNVDHFTRTGGSPAYDHGIAGYPGSLAYEDALLSIKRVDAESFLGQVVQGVHVGGGVCARPSATCDFRVKVN